MRVLHVISAYPPSRGGAQEHARQLARAQVAHGDEVHVATVWRTTRKDWLRGTTVRAPDPAASVREPDGTHVHVCGLPRRRRAAAALPAATYYAAMDRTAPRLTDLHRARAEELLDEVRPDVVHLSRIGREGLYQAFADEARRRRLPWVLTPNHHPHWTRRRDAWWWRLYRDAGAILVLSDTEGAALVSGGVQPDRIVRTVVGAVGVTADREPVTLPPQPRVVFLGQVRRYKGLELVADAVDQLRSEGLDATLDVIGPWVDGAASLRRRLERADHVVVHGRVDEATKRRLLVAGRVLCVPSTEEALGGVYLEAWTLGRPAVGADIPPVRELFERTGGGVVVTPTVSGVTDGLQRLLTDDATARAAATAGRAAVQEAYTWEAARTHACAAYERAARSSAGVDR